MTPELEESIKVVHNDTMPAAGSTSGAALVTALTTATEG